MEIKLYNELPKEAVEIRHKVFVEEQGFQNEFDETDKFSKHLVLYDAEIPIATCRFFPSSYRKYIIGRIAVIKQYRGQNIGSRLLTLAENEIKKVGGTQIYLHAQDRARKFYEKKGYSCCGKIDLDENCPHIWMHKEMIKPVTHFRQCSIDDLDILRDFSRQRFFETFSAMNTQENMTSYLEEFFSTEKIRNGLTDANTAFYFLYRNGKLAGYLKLNEAPAQTDIHDEQSLEIERIYVSREFQGEGLGRFLMDKAINIAAQRNKKYIWLGVWEKNDKALRFYQKSGFYQIGTHLFVIGDDKQTDYIMRKDLEE